MKTQHTPGPWNYESIHPDNGRTQIGSPKDFIAEIISYGKGDGENQNDEEQQANARLIASAPELLEALDDLVEYLGKEWKDDEFVRKAKKAIKKATN